MSRHCFQIEKEALVEIGFLFLVVEFFDAAGFQPIRCQQFPQLIRSLFQFGEPQREGGRVFVDANEVELREIGQQ